MTTNDLDVELPARLFAAAWQSVAVACSEDEDRPALHRAVCIEDHGDCVLLVATDSVMLMRAPVPRDPVDAQSPVWMPPTLDELPKATVVARDVDRRMKALMAWIFRASKDDPDATVRLRVERGDDADAPALMPEMESVRLVVEADQETLRLPTFDGDWVAWRSLELGRKPAAVGEVMLSAELLKRCGSVVLVDGAPLVQFGFAGPAGPVKFSYVGCTPAIEGLVMPLRTGRSDPTLPEMS